MPVGVKEKTEAVEAAKELFRRQGYSETSMSELLGAANLNRYGFYTTFESKRQIFFDTLEAYFAECKETLDPVLNDMSLSPLTRMREVYRHSVEKFCAEGHHCLVFQVAVEEARTDPEIASMARIYLDRISIEVEDLMREAAEKGELNPNLSPKTAAQLVINSKMSMSMYGRLGFPASSLEQIVEATLHALAAPKPQA